MVDDHGSTPLHIACSSNPTVDVIEALISAHPQAVSDKDNHGDTPMHVALCSPDVGVDVIGVLLRACPTVASIANREGLMPIHVACRFCPRNEEVVGMLVDAYPFSLRTHIKMGDPAPTKKEEPLVAKKESDHVILDGSVRSAMNTSDLRFRARGEQIRDGAYPLHMAIAAGATLSVIEILIAEAPDVLTMGNKYGSTPLHVALDRGADSNMIDLLLSSEDGKKAARVPDRIGGNLPIHVAATKGCSVEVAKSLLKAYPNAIHAENGKRKNPLEVALESGRCCEEVIHLLKLSDAAEDVQE